MEIKSIIKEMYKVVNETNEEPFLYDLASEISEYASWYRGNVPSWHNYTIHNGKKHVHCKRLSLGMAKRVCEDWANLLMNEKTDIVLGDEKSQETIERIFERNKFWRRANKNVEKYFALSIGAWVVSVENLPVNERGEIISRDGDVKINLLHGENIVPITIENEEVTECAFLSTNTNYADIVLHIKNERNEYLIVSLRAYGKNGDYKADMENIQIFDTKSSTPWFVILQPHIANNIDINSPLGISVFANSIDTLKEIDLVFDSLANEFALGKKRIFINEIPNFKRDPVTGEEIPIFDSNDVVLYQLPEAEDGKQSIVDVTQDLRVTEHKDGLQQLLNLLSYQCGFGTEHYKFDGGSVSTATQIISENSEMFRNIKKQEILIEDALVSLVHAVAYAVNNFTADHINDENVNITFDDSIIEDKASEIANDRLDVQLGVMSKAEYRAKWYGETEEEAQRKIDEMSVFTIADNDQDYTTETENGTTNEDNA